MTVLVTNTGGQSGNYRVILRIDGLLMLVPASKQRLVVGTLLKSVAKAHSRLEL